MKLSSIGSVIKKGVSAFGKVGGAVGVPGAQILNLVMGAINESNLTAEQKFEMKKLQAAINTDRFNIEEKIEASYTEAATKIHGQAHKTLRVAISSDDWFVRRASPQFIWVMGIITLLNYGGIFFANFYLAAKGLTAMIPVEIPNAVWGIMISWFGVWRILRHREKQNGVAS